MHVLITNWNGRHHLASCLVSLKPPRHATLTVHVLDNGSTDGSQAWLASAYPSVVLQDLGRNLGFAAANNIGMRIARSSGAHYVVLLNNDTRLEDDWLDALVDAAEERPRAAICHARQRTWDGSKEVHFRFIPQWAEAEQELLPISKPTKPVPTVFASGCAMLVRCSSLERIGLFDERYFMYVEDVDLSLRAWITGFEVLDVPESIVYHRITGSPSTSYQRMKWGYRNQLTTLLKLYETTTLVAFAGAIRRRWFFTRNRYALRAALEAITMLGGTVRRRRVVQLARRVPDTAFLGLTQD